jgi:flagellar hook-basal body complex protein FliE
MEIHSASLGQVASPSAISARVARGDADSSPFLRLIELANSQQMESDDAITKLATGEANSIHDVVLSTAKADMTFRLVLEIRNRITEAYQEIMRMQV